MALIGDLVTYRSCIQNLVMKDLKLKYRDSVFGFLWSLLNPLFMLAVYTLAFKHIFRVQIENYPFFLLAGLMPWGFFSGAVMASTQSIISNGNLIRKVYFPREVLPLSTVLFFFAQFILALSVVLTACIILFRITVHWTALLLVPLLVLHLGFTIGVAFVLSTVTTFFRDVAHFVEMVLILLFWMTPIMYEAEMAPPLLQRFFEVSPLAAFAIGYQHILYRGAMPPGWVWVATVTWTVLLLTSGLAIFRSRSAMFAEAI